MTIQNKGPGPFPQLARRAARYRALADDLDKIARGEHPTAANLEDAPMLFEWRLQIHPGPFLTGVVLGHPYIADGSSCYTSELITFDPVGGYARTMNRFYRLRSQGRDGPSETT